LLSLSSVSRVASPAVPASTGSAKMCQRALYAVETNAMRSPSGDQRGSMFTAPFAVTGRTAPVARSKSSSSIASLA